MTATSPRFKDWTPDRLPDLAGKYYLITGGNSGIGLEAALILANRGADITIACRNPVKAEDAAARIDAAGPGSVSTVALDLASLSSVREAAATMHERAKPLDALINNAGIMQTPPMKTEDGFELQFGVNHLGHFLLTALMFDMVKPGGRIVSVASIAHKYGRMNFKDVMHKSGYTPMRAYSQAKLANLLFIKELDRRLRASGDTRAAIACHPGYSATNLQSTGPTGAFKAVYSLTNKFMAQPAAKGAWPTLLAAADTDAQSGGYYGPTGFLDAAGPVGEASITPQGCDMDHAARLWTLSEELVGETFGVT